MAALNNAMDDLLQLKHRAISDHRTLRAEEFDDLHAFWPNALQITNWARSGLKECLASSRSAFHQ